MKSQIAADLLETSLLIAAQALASGRLAEDGHGNVSVSDGNYFCIKPSGRKFSEMRIPEGCTFEIASGDRVPRDSLNPSVDTQNHLEIYRAMPWIRAVVHTHSKYATAWAIAGRAIECASTEQADIFGGRIACLGRSAVQDWGKIVSGFLASARPGGALACLLNSHGVVVVGRHHAEVVKLAAAVEMVAEKNYLAERLLSPWRATVLNSLPADVVAEWRRRYQENYGQK